MQYMKYGLPIAIYLQSTPHVFGALLAKASDPTTADNILQRLKTEWVAILAMEARKESRVLLHKLCPHVEWQVTRELHSFLCSKGHNIDDDLLALLSGWFPRLSGPCDVEQIFQSMERSLKLDVCWHSSYIEKTVLRIQRSHRALAARRL